MVATLDAWLSRFWSPVPWNAIIWLGSSIIVSVSVNEGIARLWFAPVLAGIFLAALVGNEVVAHFVFGTCLYD